LSCLSLQASQGNAGRNDPAEAHLPASSKPNFRERLVAQLEAHEQQEVPDPEFPQKAAALLAYYEQVFGVTDVVDKPGEE
jgi:hypothetical protein